MRAYESEVAAIAAFYERDAAVETPRPVDVDILCVDPSPDLLAYLREVLKQARYGVMTATNVSDALTLRRATRPKVVVIGKELRSANTGTADLFNRLDDGASVVELPAQVSTQDAGDAARKLLDDVAVALAP